VKLDLQNIQRGAARIVVGAQGGRVVEISGVLREHDEGMWLKRLVADIHAAAVARRLEEVTVDLRGLTYCNATAWKCFVQWLRLLREDPAARYQLRVISSPDVRWQLVGMAALRAFGGDRLVIEHRRPDVPGRSK
jgi:hypothetical protein